VEKGIFHILYFHTISLICTGFKLCCPAHLFPNTPRTLYLLYLLFVNDDAAKERQNSFKCSLYLSLSKAFTSSNKLTSSLFFKNKKILSEKQIFYCNCSPLPRKISQKFYYRILPHKKQLGTRYGLQGGRHRRTHLGNENYFWTYCTEDTYIQYVGRYMYCTLRT
jgi:hypothetical protein